MINLKRRNEMENNIELFERYINDRVTPAEKEAFDLRLKTDKSFLTDFRIYLFALDGIYKEAEHDNAEFGLAMKNISDEELLRIIGRSQRNRIFQAGRFRERMIWLLSIASIIIIGIFSVFRIQQSDMDRLDDIIVDYNYIPDSDRSSGTTLSASDIPTLEKIYHDIPDEDIQTKQEAGMRLAMAYLKKHDRKKAKEILTELSVCFADDEEFVAQCHKIINQLK